MINDIFGKTVFMKRLALITCSCFLLWSCSNSNEKIETMKVWGNCGMCKKNIEGSLELEGVYNANWDKNTKVLTVVYDSILLSKETIATYISKVGYDNEYVKGDDEAYDKLHFCCQYERK